MCASAWLVGSARPGAWDQIICVFRHFAGSSPLWPHTIPYCNLKRVVIFLLFGASLTVFSFGLYKPVATFTRGFLQDPCPCRWPGLLFRSTPGLFTKQKLFAQEVWPGKWALWRWEGESRELPGLAHCCHSDTSWGEGQKCHCLCFQHAGQTALLLSSQAPTHHKPDEGRLFPWPWCASPAVFVPSSTLIWDVCLPSFRCSALAPRMSNIVFPLRTLFHPFSVLPPGSQLAPASCLSLTGQ